MEWPRAREGKRRGRKPKAKKPNKPLDPAAEKALIVGPLFKQFCDAFAGGPPGEASRKKFSTLLAAGENADEIIDAATKAKPGTNPDDWLDACPWIVVPARPTPKPAPERVISPQANGLANELAEIAGQDLDFLEPGWCGAAWRCQQWLNEG